MSKMKIKICGITKSNEIDYLKEADVDYAGFVFFEKSKRNISIEAASQLKAKLPTSIQAVAVTVSPEVSLMGQVEAAGFDILQVHKKLSEDLLDACTIPLWYAVNISKEEELMEQYKWLSNLSTERRNKIKGLVVDGAEYGSGKTFQWQERSNTLNQILELGFDFILAGGLRSENVKEGIEIYHPNVVDVSSGVEGDNGKDQDKIMDFVGKVRG